MSQDKPEWQEIPKLGKITCTSSNCEDDLHCFKQTRKMALANQTGQCRACGVALIDWDRVHKRDVSDAVFDLVDHFFLCQFGCLQFIAVSYQLSAVSFFAAGLAADIV